MNKPITLSLFALLATLALAAHADADSYRVPQNSAFEEECGSCHVAFPPPMLHKSVANCTACHTGAAACDYSDHSISIPQ